ncbi:MAG: tetratricopeptide repeat protein, partial [Terriglobia bacterium]
LSPSSPWIHILSGQAFDGLGQYEKALHEFQQARQELPDDPTVRFSLGFMDWKLHHFDEAIVELQATLRLAPQFNQAKFYLADSYLAEQKPREALPILENYAKENARDYRTLVDLGKAYRDLGQLQQAQQALWDAVRVNPTLPEAHYLLAGVDQKLHETKDAQHELALTQKLQSQKIEQAETLLNASGARGDPTQQLGIVPAPRKLQGSAPSPH